MYLQNSASYEHDFQSHTRFPLESISFTSGKLELLLYTLLQYTTCVHGAHLTPTCCFSTVAELLVSLG